jgi:hypothetical protein
MWTTLPAGTIQAIIREKFAPYEVNALSTIAGDGGRTTAPEGFQLLSHQRKVASELKLYGPLPV